MQFTNELVTEYNPILCKMAKSVYRTASADSCLNWEDIRSQLLVHLWEATQKYDQSRGAKFNTFLYMYLDCRIKNIRRGISRANAKGTAFMEELPESMQKAAEVGVYSNQSVIEMELDIQTVRKELTGIENRVFSGVVVEGIKLKDFASSEKISYSRAYRHLSNVRSEITKIC